MSNKVNRGSIFKNEKKTASHPDFSGTINVDGKECKVAMWVRESKEGKKYFSVSIKPEGTAPEKPKEEEWQF